MNNSAIQSPRFGAAMQVHYKSDLTPQSLEKAVELVKTQEAFKARVAAIEDQVDPIHIGIHISNEDTFAQLATRTNGTKTLKLENSEPLTAFFEKVVKEAETLAPQLKPDPATVPMTRTGHLLTGAATAAGAALVGNFAYSILSGGPATLPGDGIGAMIMLPFTLAGFAIGLAAGAGSIALGGASAVNLFKACFPKDKATPPATQPDTPNKPE